MNRKVDEASYAVETGNGVSVCTLHIYYYWALQIQNLQRRLLEHYIQGLGSLLREILPSPPPPQEYDCLIYTICNALQRQW